MSNPTTTDTKAQRDLRRLGEAAFDFPWDLVRPTPEPRIQLRTLAGRARSYPCRVDAPRTRARPTAQPRSTAKTKPRSKPKRKGMGKKAAAAATSRAPGAGVVKPAPRRGVTTFPADVTRSVPRGLSNPGNFCYRRALLQCLLHVPALHAHWTETHGGCDGLGRRCVACGLREFWREYWTGRTGGSFPKGAVKVLDETVARSFDERQDGSYAGMVVGAQQSDVHEFLTFLWKKLEAQAGETRAALDRLFAVEQEIAWTCEDCGHRHVRGAQASREQGWTLPLAQLAGGDASGKPPSVSLFELLDGHCSEIRCSGAQCAAERQWETEQGLDEDKTNKDRTQARRIARGPEVLCINIGRTYADWTVRDPSDWVKLRHDVDFPEDLDLTGYTVHGKPLQYRLFGVAAHSGDSVLTGHWIAVVRHRDGERYWTINDATVYEAAQTFDEMRFPADGEGEPFDPTLLVYVKVIGA